MSEFRGYIGRTGFMGDRGFHEAIALWSDIRWPDFVGGIVTHNGQLRIIMCGSRFRALIFSHNVRRTQSRMQSDYVASE